MDYRKTKAVPKRCEDFVRDHAIDSPQACALVYRDKSYTYQELVDAIDRCASGLLRAGIQKGDRVATLAPPDDKFLISFLATLSVGAIWQGLNPRYQAQELRYLVEDASPSLIFAERTIGDRDYIAALTAMTSPASESITVVALDTWEDDFSSAIDSGELEQRRSDLGDTDAAIIVYTSGSTGRPKGALLTHEAIVSMSLMQNRVWPADPLVALNFLPINHVGSIVDITMPVITGGGKLIMMDQFDPDGSLDLMEQHKVTVWGSVPSVLQMQIASPRFTTVDLSSVELIVWEGAAISQDTFETLKGVCPKMATNYGMTETTSAITITEPTSDEDILLNTVGLPVENVDVRIADDADRQVADGETGEIQTRSIYNISQYWHNASATADAYTADGYFKTGDLGRFRADGRLQLVGRKKEMFKSGGYNVYPREIEDALESHPAIAVAAVVGAEHTLWGECGVAFMLATGEVAEEDILRYLRERLANYKLPKALVFVEDFPLLPIGKIDKQALKSRASLIVKENLEG
ncbi:MAG: class I adenylate-forming enzyme family protein [Pseudomonadota bacterium]